MGNNIDLIDFDSQMKNIMAISLNRRKFNCSIYILQLLINDSPRVINMTAALAYSSDLLLVKQKPEYFFVYVIAIVSKFLVSGCECEISKLQAHSA